MNAIRFPIVKITARASTGLAALLAFHSALAVDEYVVYGKRAQVIPPVDRVALRAELDRSASVVAGGALADSVRAALADALRPARAPSDLRFASNDQRPRG